MKRKLVLIIPVVALCLLVEGCTKERTCRCAVRNSSVVRIIDINKGNCEDIKVYRYHDEVDSLFTDSLLCTDHVFGIDSIYNN